jgi:RHS repeat-associated protein
MESGEKVDYSYDSLDRLTAEKRTDFYGQILAWDIYEYDLAGNRTRKTILDASGSTLLTVNYALASGNRLAEWNVPETNLMAKFPVAGAASEVIGTNDRFGYLWVSNATAGGMAVKPEVDGTNFWTYDFTVGMGTQKIVAAIRDAAGNMGYATNTIIPVVVTNGAYQYSAAGCLTNISYKGKDTTKTLGLTWDGQYQLTAVATNGGVVESYKFDAAGRRVMTASAGVTNWHVYIDQHVIADLDSTGGVARTYMWGPGIDNLLAMTVYTNSGGTTSVSSVYYAIKDHLNSVLALTDSSGQIVEQYRYDAWGRTTVFDGNGNPLALSAVGNRYLWQGREYSWKTGLYNFRARWADPVTGRWLSNDPIGISGGLNQYVFCANNPVNFRDPTGLCTETVREIESVVDTTISGSGFWGAITGGRWAGSGRNVDQDRRYVDTQLLGTIDLQHVVSGGMAIPGTTTIGGFVIELGQWLHGDTSGFRIEDLISNDLGANARNETLFGNGNSIGQNIGRYISNAGIVGGLYGNEQHELRGPRLPCSGLNLSR